MIAASELRIGNLVQRPESVRIDILDRGKIYWLVDSLMIRDCEYYKENWAFEAIPLTPKILEDFGFKRDEEGWVLDFDNKLYDPLGRSGTGGLCQRDTTVFAYKHTKYILNVGVRYLHQLQNIYFSLTNKELKINL